MADTINVGRKTLYGNPILIGRVCPLCAELHSSAGSTISCYRLYLFMRLKTDTETKGQAIAAIVPLPEYDLSAHGFSAKLRELRGYRLFCPGCETDSETCHARVLERAIEWLIKTA